MNVAAIALISVIATGLISAFFGLVRMIFGSIDSLKSS